ncbi:bifunctional 4-hydroxy-2-oxoglutarate aldolase/2-dehydro-3-deoxy-phosphogluconate aldolase [Microlunatus sp. Y2014]|uniref:bifunctional 4-hydroxy-2-oxoglutarate aldolase/2-dehydro-3-deoxy-phosphogluconate aldolase n=1 Tax=Microlunatus sp. Y2014 TaxID=3418488 RepID=UPI003DA71ECD
MDVLEQIGRTRLVPVIALDRADQAEPLGEALVAGGLPVAEVTFRTAAAAEAIQVLSGDSHILVGAGTVVSAAQVDVAVEAGARYIVSPGFSATVAQRCAEHGIPLLPGVATATEVMMALDAGITTVKFFPAGTSGGAPAIKALSAPFPQVRFVPTGGISAANLADYLAIDAVLACGGSWMVPPKAINAGDFATITTLADEAVTLAAQLRGT